MDSLNGIAMFVTVAETRSFTRTARQFGVSASAVGKSIARMEERLAVRLFYRSTRSITLTREGVLFLDRCRRILSEIEAAEAELSELSGTPRGRLRVAAPQLTALVMPTLTGFMRRFPDIALDLDLSERSVDLIEDGYDALIRTDPFDPAGAPLRTGIAAPLTADSRLSARRIGSSRQLVLATPGYLARHGTPAHPRDLAGHACLLRRLPHTGHIEHWPFTLAAGEAPPQPGERLTSSTFEALRYALLQGEGIAFLPTFIIADALRDGALVTLLAGYIDHAVTLSMLWPSSRYASPKLRVLIDYVAEHMVL